MADKQRPPTCWGYGRHSTNKQELTEEVQRYRTYTYWKQNLRHKGVAWGGFFYDSATQGRVPLSERKHGRELFLLAQPGDHIVVTKLDRPFRSLRDGINSIDQFQARRVTFHSLDLLIDTSTPLGRFFRTILLAVAELEREFTSERVKETIALRKRQGLPHSSACPIGWKIVGTKPNRRYRVDHVERALVDVMAVGREDGLSYEALALWSMKQKELPAKRTFPTREVVKWALNARLAGYPKVTNYKTFHRMVRDGAIKLKTV